MTLFILSEGRGFLWIGSRKKKVDREDGVRFRALRSIDGEMAERQPKMPAGVIPLTQVCSDFRAFAASQLVTFLPSHRNSSPFPARAATFPRRTVSANGAE